MRDEQGSSGRVPVEETPTGGLAESCANPRYGMEQNSAVGALAELRALPGGHEHD